MLPFHPYADLFPLIEGEEFAELVADVRANDLRDKIVVWEGRILDGRNRYRAAVAAGLIDREEGSDRPKYFVRFVSEVDGSPLAFVISRNLRRRHLTDIQRASVAGKIANLQRGRPGENPPIGGISAEAAAATLNVAPRQVERARVVHEQGVAELRQALDRGEIAVSRAEQIARLPEREQRAQLPNGARAIMGSRVENAESLDYSPTPPYGTRALMERVLPHLGIKSLGDVWEPACGEGHIAEVLAEYGERVLATDIHPYGYGQGNIDFLAESNPYPQWLPPAQWIVTNPPFRDKAEQFALRALERASIGVAIFARLQWLETIGRYERLFRDQPPTLIAFFCERINLCMGRWDPEGGTATAYIWLVWVKGMAPQPPFWIPPGCRKELSRPDDVERFTAHPVIKRERPTTADGSPILHDEETGEIAEKQGEAA